MNAMKGAKKKCGAGVSDRGPDTYKQRLMIERATELRAKSWNLSDWAEAEVVKRGDKHGLDKGQFRDRTWGGSSCCLGKQEKHPNAPVVKYL